MFRYPFAMKAIPGVALGAALAVGVVVVNRSREDPRTSLYLQAKGFYQAVGAGRLAEVADRATPAGQEAARDWESALRNVGGAHPVIESVVVEPEGRGRVLSEWDLPDGRHPQIEDEWRQGAGGEWLFVRLAKARGNR